MARPRPSLHEVCGLCGEARPPPDRRRLEGGAQYGPRGLHSAPGAPTGVASRHSCAPFGHGRFRSLPRPRRLRRRTARWGRRRRAPGGKRKQPAGTPAPGQGHRCPGASAGFRSIATGRPRRSSGCVWWRHARRRRRPVGSAVPTGGPWWRRRQRAGRLPSALPARDVQLLAQQGAGRAGFTLGPQWLQAEPAGSYGKDRDCQYAQCEHCPEQARPSAILAPGTPARRCPMPDGLGSHPRGGGTSQGSTANSPSGTRSAQTATAGVTRTSWRVTRTCPSSPLVRALRYTRQSYHWLWVTDYLGLVDERGAATAGTRCT